MKNILIAGGTGLIGKSLANKLKEKGYSVHILTRNPNKKSDFKLFYWNPLTQEIDENSFQNIDYIINLTGENISEKRWTKTQKRIIEDSRILSTQLFIDQIKKQKLSLKAYISASAIGYYGTYTSDKIFKETDLKGDDYLADVGFKWENSVNPISKNGIRTVILRTGVVFSRYGGAFPKLIGPLKFKMLPVLASGKQYVPWIHMDDLVSMYIYALENETIKGIYNAVSPAFDKNSEIMKIIKAETAGRFVTFKVPGFILKLVFGEMSSILLYGSRVSAEKIVESGFSFQFPTIEKAVNDLMKV